MVIFHPVRKTCTAYPLVPSECGYEDVAKGCLYGPWVRDFYVLHFVVSGKGVFHSKNKSYPVAAGDLFVIRPYEITSYRADHDDPYSYYWIGFRMPSPPPAILDADLFHAPELLPLFRRAVEKEGFSEKDVSGSYETFLSGILLEIFGLLMRKNENRSLSHEEYVARAIAIMQVEYVAPLSIAEVARRLHLNRSYFTTLFKEKTGLSPCRYLTDIRMKKAAELFSHHGLSVAVTALSVGYPDIFAFSRAFKRYFSVSPTEYRRLCEKGLTM